MSVSSGLLKSVLSSRQAIPKNISTLRVGSRTNIRRPFSLSSVMASSMPAARVKSIDHIVLTVKNIDATVKFYEGILGMQHEVFDTPTEKRHALSFGSQKINLHKSGAEFSPRAGHVMPGSGDLCFVVHDDVNQVLGKLQSAGIDVLEGGKVVSRTGAVGNLQSIYFRDPDENLIE